MQPNAIEIGKRLTSDVMDPRGTVLMRAGTILTPHHLQIFRAWGITELPVEASPPPPETQSGTTDEDDLRQLLDARFALTNRDHPAIQVLYDYCLEHAHGPCK